MFADEMSRTFAHGVDVEFVLHLPDEALVVYGGGSAGERWGKGGRDGESGVAAGRGGQPAEV